MRPAWPQLAGRMRPLSDHQSSNYKHAPGMDIGLSVGCRDICPRQEQWPPRHRCVGQCQRVSQCLIFAHKGDHSILPPAIPVFS